MSDPDLKTYYDLHPLHPERVVVEIMDMIDVLTGARPRHKLEDGEIGVIADLPPLHPVRKIADILDWRNKKRVNLG